MTTPARREALVVGGSGFVGRRLVAGLVAAQRPVLVLSRDPVSARRVLPAGAQIVSGDLLRPETLVDLLSGVRAVFYLVHSMGGAGSPEGFEARDRRAAENLVDAASRAGVERIIYVGGLGDESPFRSPHLDSRREVGRILARGAPKLTTLRAAIVVGAGGSSFEMVVQLVERLPVLLCPSWIRTRCQPIDVRDLVAYLIGCLDAPETAGRTFDVGGPEALPYFELIGRIGRRLGRYSRVIALPILTPGLSSHWVGLITSVPASVARDLVEGMRSEVVCREDSIRALVPVPLHSLDEAIDDALEDRPLHPLPLRQLGAAIFGTPSADRAVVDVAQLFRAGRRP